MDRYGKLVISVTVYLPEMNMRGSQQKRIPVYTLQGIERSNAQDMAMKFAALNQPLLDTGMLRAEMLYEPEQIYLE